MEPTFQLLAGCPHPSHGPENNAGPRVGWEDLAPPQVPRRPFLRSLVPTTRIHPRVRGTRREENELPTSRESGDLRLFGEVFPVSSERPASR